MITLMKKILFLFTLSITLYFLSFLIFNHLVYQYVLNQSQFQIQGKQVEESFLHISYNHPTIYIEKDKINIHFNKLLVGLAPLGFIEAVGMCQKYYVDIKFTPFETILKSDDIPSFCINSNLSNIFYNAKYNVRINHNGISGVEFYRDILVDNVNIKFIKIQLHHNQGLIKIGCDNTIQNYSFNINYKHSNPIFNTINQNIIFICQQRYLTIFGNVLTPQISLTQNNLTNK